MSKGSHWVAAVKAIRDERARQVSAEGFSAAHDDGHHDGALWAAGRIYLALDGEAPPPAGEDGRPQGWPWAPQDFRPKDEAHNIVRGAALLLAEKERRERAGEAASFSLAAEMDAAVARLAGILGRAETVS